MILSQLQLNPRHRDARRDLANVYEMHSTLARVFAVSPDEKSGGFLWRLEPSRRADDLPILLVQSDRPVNREKFANDYLIAAPREREMVLLDAQTGLNRVKIGDQFRFRLRANPTACLRADKNGNKLPEQKRYPRVALYKEADQKKWLLRQAATHGFQLAGDEKNPPVEISAPLTLRAAQRDNDRRRGQNMALFSVLFDGQLIVTDPEKFTSALRNGIGRGKALGQGLLSVARI